MMEGKIIFTGKSNSGREIVLRYPKLGDAPAMLEHINTLSVEETFILWQGDQMTLEKEEEYLKDLLKKVEERKATPIMVFSGERLLGWGSVEQSRLAEKHVADLHIAIQKDFRGDGIGTLLLECLLSEAKQQMEEIRIIRLGVFANNPIALEMYKKFGFVEYGNLPKGLLHRGEYIDHIYMYKTIRD